MSYREDTRLKQHPGLSMRSGGVRLPFWENQGEATQLLSIVEAIPSELLQEIYTADSDNKANPITALLNSIPLDGSHAAQLCVFSISVRMKISRRLTH